MVLPRVSLTLLRQTQIQWLVGGLALGWVIKVSLCFSLWCRGRSSFFSNPAVRDEGLLQHHGELVMSSYVLLLWRHVADDDDSGELSLPFCLSFANWLPSQRGQSTSVPEGGFDETTLHKALSPFICLFTKMLPSLNPTAGGWADSVGF